MGHAEASCCFFKRFYGTLRPESGQPFIWKSDCQQLRWGGKLGGVSGIHQEGENSVGQADGDSDMVAAFQLCGGEGLSKGTMISASTLIGEKAAR